MNITSASRNASINVDFPNPVSPIIKTLKTI